MRISSSIAAARALILTLALGAPGLQALDRQTKIAQFVHTAWTGNQIPFRQVWHLAQTTDGYLWISSADGVFRFDGIRFTRFEPPSGEAIPRSIARELLATRDGSLWMVFLSGQVSRVRDGHVTTFSLQELPRTNWLAEDRDGSIVAATGRPGLARFRDGRWQKIADALHYSAKYSYYLFFDRDGALWVRTEDRLRRLAPNEKYFTDPGAKLDSPIDRSISAKSPDLHQTPFAQAPDGTIWFAQSRVSAHTVWPGNRPAAEVKFSYSSLAQFDREGALWLGSGDAGLRRVRFPEQIAGKSIADSSPEVEHFTRKDGLSGDFVISSLLDREGNLWFGTDAGLDRFRDGAFRRLVLPHPERVSDVLPLQPKGLLIRSTTERLLQRVNPDDTVTVLPQPTPFSGACEPQRHFAADRRSGFAARSATV